tara:strand:- start:579 stop:779 length:201 start_codon:yes stop_codon:yes gene_type:complete
MELTTKDKAVLKALVERELQEMKDEKIDFVNSPVLSSLARFKETDLDFMKTETLYQEFLAQLLNKL